MSEFSPIQDDGAARAFLDIVSPTTRRRGERYFARGAVRGLTCVRPGTEYRAQVQGTMPYTTTLMCRNDEWFSLCTCPVGEDCKHAVAVMLAVLARSEQAGQAAAAEPGGLETAVAAALSRALAPAERQFVKRVQQLYRDCRYYRTLTPHQVLQLFPQLRLNTWEALDLWPQFPASEVEFWQYLAYWVRRWGGTVPEFMAGVAASATVARRVAERQRRQEIELWRHQLETQDQFERLSPLETRVLDCRLIVGAEKLAVETRTDAADEYRPVKSNRLRMLSETYKAGNLPVAPESLALWHALAELWAHTYRIELSVHDSEVQRTLNGLLRMPGLETRVLAAGGVPFVRAPEPLRWELRPAGDAADDFELRLAGPDGATPAGVLFSLPGRPTLYVTATTIYAGPVLWKPFGSAQTAAVIPAPALVSGPGLRLLQKLGVELPAALQQRVRHATLKVKITCDLKPAYPGAAQEIVAVRITAAADGARHQETYLTNGWQEEYRPPGAATEEFCVFDRTALAPAAEWVLALGLKWSGYDHYWFARLTKKFPDQFTAWLATLPAHVEVLLDKQLATLRGGPVAASVRLDCEPAGVDWFDLKVVLDVQDTELTPEELQTLLKARGGYVRLGKKGWRRLQFNLSDDDDERLARLGLNSRDFSDEPQRLHALQLADDAAAKLLPAERVAEVKRRAGEIKTRVAPLVPAGVSAELRPYQIEGFHFLAYLSANHFGGILADDMGLGKTLQTLTWLAWLRAEVGVQALACPENGNRLKPVLQQNQPSLVVCPKSVMDNWRAEAERFVPGLRVVLWNGSNTAAALPATLANADVFVINYAQLRSLGEALDQVRWLAAILDEGQYIKNPESKTARFARALKADHRLVLTGTPIENRLLDLWSLMAFAMPGVLGNRAQFANHFDQAEDPLARRRLSARVRPFLLRRTKKQVATELPDRVEEDLHCEMDGVQETLYRAEFKHAQQMLLKIKTRQDFDKNRFNFLTSLLRLRQICCHPALVDPKQAGAESAKLAALLDLLEPLMDEGHKVLVFSQFVSLIELVQPVVVEKGWKHFVLTGATEDRGPLVAEFQQATGAAVFLISLKAGGFGLNLTAASYVVLFDPWWNPAVENQAIDRTHRIGQTQKVMAYRLLIKDSIEDKIRALQRTKSALAEDVLGEERFAQSLTLDDLKFLFADA